MSKHHKHRHDSIIEFEDPVCKMKVSPKSAIAETEYEHKIYYFCSQNCREQFVAAPEEYLSKKKHFRS